MSAFSSAGWTPPRRPQNAEAVQYLLDRTEIHDALMRYLRGVDRGDEELVRPVYHDDAVDDRGPFSLTGADRIAADIVGRVTRVSEVSSHTVCNELIEIEGDTAYSETYFIAYQRIVSDGKVQFRSSAGRYVDRWERRQDRQWRIARRTVVGDWARVETIASEEPAFPGFVHGSRSREDASYQRP